MIDLDSMSKEQLLELRERIDVLLNDGRPKPKWPGGVTLWHKVLRRKVRAIYDDGGSAFVWWDKNRDEWVYQDKYSGELMFESDIATSQDSEENDV